MARKQGIYIFRCPYESDAVRDQLVQQTGKLTERKYLVMHTEQGFDLGIGRGGHGSGYWYCATVLPDGDGSIIRGRMEYRNASGWEVRESWMDKITFALLFLLFLPIILVVRVYRIFRPEITMEDRFVDFMIHDMGCELIDR